MAHNLGIFQNPWSSAFWHLSCSRKPVYSGKQSSFSFGLKTASGLEVWSLYCLPEGQEAVGSTAGSGSCSAYRSSFSLHPQQAGSCRLLASQSIHRGSGLLVYLSRQQGIAGTLLCSHSFIQSFIVFSECLLYIRQYSWHRIYRKQTEKVFLMHEGCVYKCLRVIKRKYKNAIRRRKIGGWGKPQMLRRER